jgi:hypothetical protein
MLMRMAILAGLAVVLLAGCGSDEGGSGDAGGGQVKLDGPLTYERGGGIAGRRDRLVVQPDGTGTLTVQDTSQPVKLSDADLDKLAAELQSTDLGSLPKDSTTKPPVPDAFGYRVSYGGATVTTDSPGMPKALRGLVAQLGELVDRYGR